MPRARLLLAFLAIFGSGVLLADQQTPLFEANAKIVPILVTVTDTENRLIAGLPRSAFTVFDNGRPATIETFGEAGRALDLVLLLDVSGSMARNVGLLRAGTEMLLQRLRPHDRVRLGTFGRGISIADEFEVDRDRVRARLPDAVDIRALTPLWPALESAMKGIETAENSPVIVVFTDGKDSGPDPGQRPVTLDAVIERARRQGTMIYAVGLRSPGGSISTGLVGRIGDWPDPGLEVLARQTGGLYFEVDRNPERELGESFARAIDELHAQYLIGIEPARDGEIHQLTIEVAGADLTARARSSYRAPSE